MVLVEPRVNRLLRFALEFPVPDDKPKEGGGK